jgi:hypothetical protein
MHIEEAQNPFTALILAMCLPEIAQVPSQRETMLDAFEDLNLASVLSSIMSKARRLLSFGNVTSCAEQDKRRGSRGENQSYWMSTLIVSINLTSSVALGVSHRWKLGLVVFQQLTCWSLALATFVSTWKSSSSKRTLQYSLRVPALPVKPSEQCAPCRLSLF